ncbi:MAG: TrkA family potassium uptake protein [Bacteroidales bacterium]|jgi:trk system potassium uptake protein TrkA|nr:TrkA family potassium uptake protein [Bacteroidales bacterium]HHT52849.1 TrkA family potassium uptake protein [Bacteroidales bacterium]
MKNEKIAVIGAGRFGTAIAKELSLKGVEVLVIDSTLSIIQDISDDVAYAVCVDATNKRALEAENIEDYDTVIVAIGNDFEARLLCVANLLDLKVKRIVCRTLGENQKLILEKMGITEFLSPEDEVGVIVAERMLNPNILTYLQLPDQYRIAEVLTPPRIVGKTIEELNFRDSYRISLITIRRETYDSLDTKKIEEHIIGVPATSDIIEENDIFVLFGKLVDIETFINSNL